MRLSVSRVAAVFAQRRVPGPARTARSHSARQRARLAVALLAPLFAVVLLAAWAVVEAVTPEITDTDYHARLRVARAAHAERPDCPLGVVLGSSRLVWSFRPEQLPEPAPGEVSWVNVAHVGGGPTLNRLVLHRLFRDGVRPSVVVIEIMPTFFVKENSRFVSGHFALSELSLARAYADKPFGFDYPFLRHRATRAADLARAGDPFGGHVPLLPRGGHPHFEVAVTPEERAKRTAFARKNNGEYLGRISVHPGADRAFRDTLREASAYGARVVVLRTPEGTAFRSWYNPDGLVRFDAYIAAVAREHGAAVLDARDWLDDEDFYDSHHTLKRGADKFTARFARELPGRR